MVFYYVYVLYSLLDHHLYIGWTPDLRKRIEKHNSGLVKATKPRLPMKLLFYESFTDKKDSVLREKFLKSGWGRRHLKNTLKYTFGNLADRVNNVGPPAKNSGISPEYLGGPVAQR